MTSTFYINFKKRVSFASLRSVISPFYINLKGESVIIALFEE